MLEAGAVKVRVELELHLETLTDKREHFQSTYNIEHTHVKGNSRHEIVVLPLTVMRQSDL